MNMLSQKANQGVSLRKINYIMAAVSLLISLFFLFAVHRLAADYNELRELTQTYDDLKDSASELQAASDYLTEQARIFAMTGKRDYLDNYFREAEVVQRREHALERLQDHAEVADAYESLKDAMEDSVELMESEYLSMRLTILAYGLQLSEFPEAVRNVQLPEKYLNMSRSNQVDMARLLVINEVYCEKKEAISENMRRCLDDLMQEMHERQAMGENELRVLIEHLQIMVFVLIGIVLLRILITSHLVIGPLLTGVLYIREGQQLPIQGAYELRFLAHTYNQMYRENKAQTELLTFEAEHDKLTGVYNRSGYDHLLESIDVPSSALLLVDVDKFKSVNDTYGHKIGDKALVRVAAALQENFRSGDYICRIGGDEFAVIMKNTNAERKTQIERKVTRINEKLQSPPAGQPPLSISAGCAFGISPNGTGAIDKDADVALYRVKENGRCGCAFYE